jgi:hypothetical protein
VRARRGVAKDSEIDTNYRKDAIFRVWSTGGSSSSCLRAPKEKLPPRRGMSDLMRLPEM